MCREHVGVGPKVSNRVGGRRKARHMATTGGAETPEAPREAMTIADIARLAGVSVPTVSKVVNGRAEVGADTRAHVQNVLREHDYRRKARAAKSSTLLELVFHELAGTYPIEIINGVQRAADEVDRELSARS